MKTAFITLSTEGARLAAHLRQDFAALDCYAHQSVACDGEWRRFDRVVELTQKIFMQYQALIYAAPCGVVTRSIAPCAHSKLQDPAVVVLDVDARWAISLLSGHEGGANDVAMRVANIFDAEPIITTTTEAVKDLIVGVGCRRGVDGEVIFSAIAEALALAGATTARVRMIASVDIKKNEAGLLSAANKLGAPLRFLSVKHLSQCAARVDGSAFVQKTIGAPAVAEPAALLAGRRTTLLLPKIIRKGVTVAIAQENFLS